MPTTAPSAGDSTRRFVERDLLIVVVLYRVALEDSATYRSLSAELRSSRLRATLLVHDNGPVAPSPGPAVDAWDVRLKWAPENPGVSAAYRAGAELARALGRRWLLLLDQDSTFPPDALRRYAAAASAFPDVALIAPILRAGAVIVSPCRYRGMRGTPLPSVSPGLQTLDGRSVANSGLCVDVDRYLEVGGHDPALPLDYSDHDLVRRLKARDDRIVVLDLDVGHGLSGAMPADVGQRLARFRIFAAAARRAAPSPAARLQALVVVLARGALLAWRYRHPPALLVGLRAFLHRPV